MDRIFMPVRLLCLLLLVVFATCGSTARATDLWNYELTRFVRWDVDDESQTYVNTDGKLVIICYATIPWPFRKDSLEAQRIPDRYIYEHSLLLERAKLTTRSVFGLDMQHKTARLYFAFTKEFEKP